jgi:hypothetical protein
VAEAPEPVGEHSGGGREPGTLVVPDRLRLGLSFDAEALGAEAEAIPPAEWARHYNEHVYEGEWTGVALRAAGGAPTAIYADSKRSGEYEDVALLGSCPELRSALARFECPLTSVRLLSLAPGAVIREHRDYRLSARHTELRLHIPLLSAAGVEFVHNGELVPMLPGECWYLDFTLPHRVANRSDRRRIHLVVDCMVNSWLQEELVSAARLAADHGPTP